MNTPNGLTVFRLIMAFIIPFIFLEDTSESKILAVSLYTIAGATDALDGILARRRMQITTFGIILDPVADKALVLGALWGLARLGALSYWWLLPLAVREIGVTWARILLLKKGKAIAAKPSGKIKAVIQHVAVLFVFLNTYISPSDTSGGAGVFRALTFFVLLAATVTTITSGYDFFKLNGGALRAKSA